MNPVLIAHGLMVDDMVIAPVKTASFTARHNMIYPVSVTGGRVDVTAPANPKPGMKFAVYDHSKMFDSISAFVLRNGSKMMDVEEDYEINTRNAFRTFIYTGPQKGWIVQ